MENHKLNYYFSNKKKLIGIHELVLKYGKYIFFGKPQEFF